MCLDVDLLEEMRLGRKRKGCPRRYSDKRDGLWVKATVRVRIKIGGGGGCGGRRRCTVSGASRGVQHRARCCAEELANAVKEPVLDNDYKFTKILKIRRKAIKNTFYVFNF